MTSTIEQGTVTVTLTVEEWQDIAEELYLAAGNARGTDREARLWTTYRTVRDLLAQQEA